MNTNIEKIKAVAKSLLYSEPTINRVPIIMVHHPFFTDWLVSGTDENNKPSFIQIFYIDNLEDGADKAECERNLLRVCRLYEEFIDKGNSIQDICEYINEPYRMTFLKLAKPYIEKNEFDELLGDMWVQYGGNIDANITINEFVEMFSKADKTKLMSKDEIEIFNSLPEEVTIYRGVSHHSAEANALSWTCNYDIAEWFATRYNNRLEALKMNKGYILKGKVKKEDILAYFNRREESEILIVPDKVYDIEKIRPNNEKQRTFQEIKR